VVPDLIRRELTAPMPGLKLVGDITCFATGEGWLYLATAVDPGSKEVIGYALARLDIRQSTGRTGSSLDGAAAGSFFATVKTEFGTAFPEPGQGTPPHDDQNLGRSGLQEQDRRLARDYETLAGSPEAMIQSAMIDNIGKRMTDESAPAW
jgi:transposase InsO family protein